MLPITHSQTSIQISRELQQETSNLTTLDLFNAYVQPFDKISSTFAGKASAFSLDQEQPGFEAARKSSSSFGSVLPFNSTTTLSPFCAENLDFESWSDQYASQQLFMSSRMDEIPSSFLPLPIPPSVSILEDKTHVPSFTSLSPLISMDVELRGADQFQGQSLPVPLRMDETLSSSSLLRIIPSASVSTTPPKSKKRKQPHQDQRQENSISSTKSSKKRKQSHRDKSQRDSGIPFSSSSSTSSTSSPSLKKSKQTHTKQKTHSSQTSVLPKKRKEWEESEKKILIEFIQFLHDHPNRFTSLRQAFSYLAKKWLPHRGFGSVNEKYNRLCEDGDVKILEYNTYQIISDSTEFCPTTPYTLLSQKNKPQQDAWENSEIQILKNFINSLHENLRGFKSVKGALRQLSQTDLKKRILKDLIGKYDELCKKNEIQKLSFGSKSKRWSTQEIEILKRFIQKLHDQPGKFYSINEAFKFLGETELPGISAKSIYRKYRDLYDSSKEVVKIPDSHFTKTKA